MPRDLLFHDRIELVVGDGWDEIQYRNQVFWRVAVNGHVLADTARAFSAEDDRIVLHECTLCGHCGSPCILVRLVGDAVVWINNPGTRASALPLAVNEMRVFDSESYNKSCGEGDSRRLPPISDKELPLFVGCLKVPDPEKALYCTPPLNDAQGKRLVSLMQSVLADYDSLHFLEAPQLFQSVTIGFDVEGFPEARWQIGKVKDRFGIRFIDLPVFPIWLTSNTMSEALKSLTTSSSWKSE